MSEQILAPVSLRLVPVVGEVPAVLWPAVVSEDYIIALGFAFPKPDSPASVFSRAPLLHVPHRGYVLDLRSIGCGTIPIELYFDQLRFVEMVETLMQDVQTALAGLAAAADAWPQVQRFNQQHTGVSSP